MKRVTRDVVYRQTGRFNPPALTVKPGETVLVETELCTGDWLHSIDDRWSPEISRGPNPASGPLYVEGAQPGDVLAVRIDGIALDSLGYTNLAPGSSIFADWIRRREWGIVTRTLRIEGDRIVWDAQRSLPVRPMIGVLATAPEFEVLSNARPGRHGGNMDIQEITTGATVYLPVYVPGALLHVADVHALQGDGEMGGTAVEARAEVTLTIAGVSPRPRRMTWPRIESADYLMTVGCARPAEDAFRIAVQELVYWLCDDYGLEEGDAVLWLSQLLEARATQFVDPEYTYIAKVRKEFLPRQ